MRVVSGAAHQRITPVTVWMLLPVGSGVTNGPSASVGVVIVGGAKFVLWAALALPTAS